MSAQICNNCTNELKKERLKHDYEKILDQNYSSTYNIDEFKNKYSNSFLYLTHLFRNGKLIFNQTPKKKKK
jgi:lipopolysaccharide assembly outer membrane protein LptD (OstA)